MSLTQLCRPSSLSASLPAGATANWVNGAGTGPTNIDPGDPISHDADTSYRQATQPTRGDIWYCGTGKPASVEVVYSSTANVRHRGITYTPTIEVGMYSAEASLAAHATAVTGTAYANLTQTHTPTASQVNASTFGVGFRNDGTNPVTALITSAWISLVYDPPGACLIPLWAIQLVGMVGGGIGMEHLPKVAQWLSRAKELTVPPDEFPRMLEAYRKWTRPRSVWLPA